MKGLDSIKIKAIPRKHVPNINPGGILPWQVYHTVRNALVETCRRYGPTGPMGKAKIVEGEKGPYMRLAADPDSWESGDPDPWYFIIDDQLNHERICYAELYGDDPFNAGWLLSITATLRDFKEWGLCIQNIPESDILIFGKKLLVAGRLARCKTAEEVVAVATRLLKRGNKRWWQFWK